MLMGENPVPTGEPSRPKRAVKKPERLDRDIYDQVLQQAIQKSKAETQRGDGEVPEAPTFHPTPEEFKDPMRYIARIAEEGHASGIVKIVPPEGWKPEFSADRILSKRMSFATKKQEVHRLTEGVGFPKGRSFTAADYKVEADKYLAQWLEDHPDLKGPHAEGGAAFAKALEKEYWRLVETNTEKVVVEYGNDVDTRYFGSGFLRPATGRRHPWDLNAFNESPLSVLQSLGKGLPGVTSPWLYLGMLWSTFCWHTEDHYLFSVNYMHHGAPKTWYGIPHSSARTFERALKKCVPGLFSASPDLIYKLVTMLPPSVCAAHGVEVTHALQEPGHFIVTFPDAYHAGFNHGFNIAEAVNFAPLDWLTFGRSAIDEYKKGGGKRCAVFPHDKLVWDLSVGMLRGQAAGFGGSRAAGGEFDPVRLLGLQALEADGFISLVKGLYAGADGWRMLHGDLSQILEDEVLLRKWATDEGASVVQVGAAGMAGVDASGPDECSICRTLPFLAVIRCQCTPSKITCLRHGFSQCRCPASSRTLEVRVDEGEIRRVLTEGAAKLTLTCGGLGFAKPEPKVEPVPHPPAMSWPPPPAAALGGSGALGGGGVADPASAWMQSFAGGGGLGGVAGLVAGLGGAAPVPLEAPRVGQPLAPRPAPAIAPAPMLATANPHIQHRYAPVQPPANGAKGVKRERSESPPVCSGWMTKKSSAYCMSCDCNFHLSCCEPPLRAAPKETDIWLCSVCLRGQ